MRLRSGKYISDEALCWMQVKQQVQDQAFQEVRDKMPRADMAHAQDYYGISNKGYAKLFGIVKKTMKDCGFKSTATPFPSPDEVDGMKRLISRKVSSWGIEYWEDERHAGWHVATPEPTLCLMARMQELTSTFSSKVGDTMGVGHGFDGAAMAELAHGKNLGFSNVECHNQLMDGKAPKGVKGDSNQFLIGCAELDRKTGESHAVLESMYKDWLTPKVNAWEEGLKTLRKPIRDKKKDVAVQEGKAARAAQAIKAAKKTMRTAQAQASKAAEGTRARSDAEVLIRQKVKTYDCQQLEFNRS
jgi:hypothetical protein